MPTSLLSTACMLPSLGCLCYCQQLPQQVVCVLGITNFMESLLTFSFTHTASNNTLSRATCKDPDCATYIPPPNRDFPLKSGWKRSSLSASYIPYAFKLRILFVCPGLLLVTAIARPLWTMVTMASECLGH